MAQTPERKRCATKTAAVQFDRFRGLTREQIAARVRFEVLAALATSEDEALHAYDDAQYAGIVLSAAELLALAQRADRRGWRSAAQYWFTRCVHATKERGDGLLYSQARVTHREFLWRRGLLGAMERCGFSLTHEELRELFRLAIIAARLRECDALERAVSYATTLNDRVAIGTCLRIAIRDGSRALARAAAKKLGRNLTRRELLTIGRTHIRSKVSDLERVAKSIARDGLVELSAPLIARMVEEPVRLHVLRKWSRRLRVSLTQAQLERCYARWRKLQMWPDEAIRIARVLARKDPKRWRPKLRETYAWARNAALSRDYLDSAAADAFGHRIGTPLTAAELLQHAMRLIGDRRIHAIQVNAQELLRITAERIADAVDAPPDPPAKAGEKQAAA